MLHKTLRTVSNTAMTSYKGHRRVGPYWKTHLDQHHPTVAGHLDLLLTAHHRGFPGDGAEHEAIYFEAMMHNGRPTDLYAEAEVDC